MAASLHTHQQLFTMAPMIKRLSLFCTLLLSASPAISQTDTIWRHAMIAGLNLSEVSFTHWVAGGTDALAYIAGINGKSVRDDATTNWSNTYKLDFGQAKLGGQD